MTVFKKYNEINDSLLYQMTDLHMMLQNLRFFQIKEKMNKSSEN